MAKKITELTELTDIANNDLLPVVDISATATKKITPKNLAKAIYPVGSLYYSASSTSPSSSLGGTWTSVPCHEIIESGDLTGTNISYAKYRIYANGDFEVFGFTSPHNIGGQAPFEINFNFPYQFQTISVSNTLAYGGGNYANTNRYGYGSGSTIYLIEWNSGTDTALNIQEAFNCKGTLDLSTNNINTIYCWKRTA